MTAATAPSADVTFTYAPSELPIVPFNNAALMEAQWYSKSIDKWQPASAGQTKIDLLHYGARIEYLWRLDISGTHFRHC
ncbi:MAG: hypothetical protein U0X76_00090 [Bacteroidia bacterium]